MLARLPIFLCLLFFPSAAFCKHLQIHVKAEAAILINASTGAILYEKHAHKLMYPASVTKIATALYVLKAKGNQLDENVIIGQDAVASITEEAQARSNYTLPAYWLTPDSSLMGLKRDEEVSVHDLLYGMMLVSGNDASNALAHHVSGSVPNFMVKVNGYLKKIGCLHTTFYNPHGLYHPQHQTTAFDLSVMAKEALKDPIFCQIVSTIHYKRPKSNKQEATTLVQSNKLLRTGKFYYPKAFGVKTGYFSKAGHNLVAAARQDDRVLIAVLLKNKERNDMFSDAIKLFDAAFAQSKLERTVLQSGPQQFVLEVEGAANPITTYLQNDLNLTYYPAEEQPIKCLLYWSDCSLPISKNQTVGEIKIQGLDGKILMAAPLLAQETVNASLFYGVKKFFYHSWKFHPAWTALAGILLFCLLMLFLKFTRR